MIQVGALRSVRGVVFDVGETLVDESRMWTSFAARAGVTAFTLMGLIGALIERNDDHRRVWDLLGVDRPSDLVDVEAVELYADAIPCMRTAASRGLVVGIAGNQPAAVETQLRAAGVEADFIASSARWDVAKPSAEFFARIVAASRLAAEQILYVGDRLDNDVLPAREAGLRTAFVRRGPWGHVHANRPEVALADLRVDSLDELSLALSTAE